MTTRPGPVVAGMDCSSASQAALGWAAWEAHRRRLPLLLVHGYLVPTPTLTPLAPLYDEKALIAAAEAKLVEQTAWVRARHPELNVSTKVVAGSGGQALVAESASASLVVVGARGTGGFLGVRLGSVAAQVSRHAQCPVVVVRASVPGAVVVGIDGSPESAEALEFALDQAEARSVPLVCVHVWSVPQMSALSFGTVWSRNLSVAQTQLQEAAERVLAEVLAGWQEKYPGVEIKRWTVHGDEPARMLLSVADEVGAGLLVVGSRGRDGLSRLVLGSVGQTLVAHADTSVAVVHGAGAA